MEIRIGEKFTTAREVADALIRQSAELSGDFIRLHQDEEFAGANKIWKTDRSWNAERCLYIREGKKIVSSKRLAQTKMVRSPYWAGLQL